MTRHNAPDIESQLIPDTVAAKLTGVSRSTWHRLRYAGKIPPCVKIGGAVRWDRDEVLAWIKAKCPDATTWLAIQGHRLRLAKPV
jgi:excisionase family DNA binding protein